MNIVAYKNGEKPKTKNKPIYEDIIVERVYYETEINENNEEVKKRKSEKINLTKKINETAKLVKIDKASEKLKKIEQIFTTK